MKDGGDVISGLMSIYCESRDEVADLERRLDAAKEHRDGAEEKLAQAMIFRGVRQQKMMDGSLVYLQAEVLISRELGVPAEAVCEALRKAGLANLIYEAYSPQTIKALIREKREDSDSVSGEGLEAALPEELRGLVKVFARTRVRVRGRPGATREDRRAGSDELPTENTEQEAPMEREIVK